MKNGEGQTINTTNYIPEKFQKVSEKGSKFSIYIFKKICLENPISALIFYIYSNL